MIGSSEIIGKAAQCDGSTAPATVRTANAPHARSRVVAPPIDISRDILSLSAVHARAAIFNLPQSAHPDFCDSDCGNREEASLDWLSQNWVWIALAVGAYFFMTRMGGHGMGRS